MPRERRGFLVRFGVFTLGVLELVTFMAMVRWIGFGWTVLAVMGTSVLGVALLRVEGFRAWSALRRSAVRTRAGGPQEAQPSAEQLAETGARILGGMLLILPGFVTDVLGATVFLLPPLRRGIGRRMSGAVFRSFSGRPPGGPRAPGTPRQRPVVVEGEIVDSDDRRRHDGT